MRVPPFAPSLGIQTHSSFRSFKSPINRFFGLGGSLSLFSLPPKLTVPVFFLFSFFRDILVSAGRNVIPLGASGEEFPPLVCIRNPF